jgi:hypothetical protein
MTESLLKGKKTRTISQLRTKEEEEEEAVHFFF